MTEQLTSDSSALYPPTVRAPAHPLPLHKFLWRYVQNPLAGLPQAVYEEPLVSFDARGHTIAWVTDPPLIEDILIKRAEGFRRNPIERRVLFPTLGDGVLTAEGALWRWQRRVLAPLFRHAEILRYVPTMTGAGEGQLKAWRKAPSGSVQPIDRDMTETTFSVITHTMLAGGEPQQAAAVKKAGGDYLERISWEIAFGLLRLPTWVPHPGTLQMRRAARRLRGGVKEIIDLRRAAGGSRDDLLGRLLAARDPETGKPMTDDQLINNILTLLEAGHETTAKALTWTLYLLARAPEWQDRVRGEVNRIAGKGSVKGNHIGELKVTQQVIKEAMRLYPPAPMLTRLTSNAIKLGDTWLQPRTTIVIPVFAVHRHRKLWADPDRFDPARFEPDSEARFQRTQYMPFGAGPRVCIGNSFAMVEATAILATLVRGAKFEWDGRHLPEPVSRVTLRPKGGMPLHVYPLG